MTDKDLVNKIRQQLDKQVNDSDNELHAELSSCRHQALNRALLKKDRPGLLAFFQFDTARTWIAAAAVLVAVFVVVELSYQQYPDINDVVEIEILVTEDSLEFYEELEFYQWLVLEDGRSI